jgi:glycosyltransferase involved in cell wall biosynthesis
MRSALVEQVFSLGLAKRVTFAGLVPDSARYLAAFDLFALTSRTEGTPMVILEAMWAALPIIATRVGGVPDVLRARDAWLVPPEDTAAIANAIGALAGDAEHCAQLARAARERVSHAHDPATWLASYEKIYRRAVAEPQ